MEMHQLRYFVAVADEGSFSRAAERCFVSQPSLSQQIIKLEQEVGRPLFDRAGRRVLLTDAGRLLLEHARAVLMTIENATRQLKEVHCDSSGRLTVGVIPTIASYLLPPVIATFRRTHPRVELMIQEDYTQRLVASVRQGDLDIAIAALPIDDDQLTLETLGTDPLVLAVPSGHPLARKRRPVLRDLNQEPFVLISDMHCLGEQVMSICRSHEIQPKLVCRGAQISTVQALIALGEGVSLLPLMSREADRSRHTVYRELPEDKPERTVVALRHRHRYHTSHAREFLEIVRARLERKPTVDR
jgi:LysR family hydrogen peroxide-inducible transcriptional activator